MKFRMFRPIYIRAAAWKTPTIGAELEIQWHGVGPRWFICWNWKARYLAVLTQYNFPGRRHLHIDKHPGMGWIIQWVHFHGKGPDAPYDHWRFPPEQPWWKVQWPPFFNHDFKSTYKSLWLGWLLITWRWEPEWNWWPFDLSFGWYPNGD